jgi:DNA-binding NarL/FixJ family response regulator
MTLHFDVRSVLVAAGAALATAFVTTVWWQAVAAAVAVLAFGLVAMRFAPSTAHPVTAPQPPMPPAPPSPPAPIRRPSLLTRKETEVAILVAQGLTNREIKDRLVVSERTVDNHVAHILAKLDFHHRTEIAVWVVENGLLVRDTAAQK